MQHALIAWLVILTLPLPAFAQVQPGDLLALRTGGAFPGDCAGLGDSIVRVDTVTGAQTTISGCDSATNQLIGSGPLFAFGMELGTPSLASDGNFIYVSTEMASSVTVFRVDPATGDRTDLSSSLTFGGALAIAPHPMVPTVSSVSGWAVSALALFLVGYAGRALAVRRRHSQRPAYL